MNIKLLFIFSIFCSSFAVQAAQNYSMEEIMKFKQRLFAPNNFEGLMVLILENKPLFDALRETTASNIGAAERSMNLLPHPANIDFRTLILLRADMTKLESLGNHFEQWRNRPAENLPH